MPMTLGYWELRGLALPIRLLLEYTGTSYEEKHYRMGDAPDYDRSQWLNEKFKLGLDFPNLPYLIDGTHKLTQSNAIVRYLGRKHNLCGETEEEKIRVDILENQVMDNRWQLVAICFNPDFVSPAGPCAALGRQTLSCKIVSVGADSCLLPQEKLKPDYLKGLPDKLTLYSQFLGKQPWFAGDKITIADFLVYDVLDQNRIFAPGCLDVFPNLKDFMARFEGLPKIAAYLKSSRFIKVPLFLKSATWTGK
ncbi:glutathione S-transferase Mu 1-like isoform X2 [Ochotona curzoniae]|uniref:glutathione S-transferase Mu 1-like isoform X2 n=1 Tax=Ochotona curzoniae TaxID=130825 RepID=UPI001B34B10C|nr:glutathione S-transferase Mu 1-like isoform X2 [Ochotona curzoniae]